MCHGIAMWFTLYFDGSDEAITLSTAPSAPYTHWYQVRLLLETPVTVTEIGQVLSGTCQLTSGGKQFLDAQFNGVMLFDCYAMSFRLSMLLLLLLLFMYNVCSGAGRKRD